MNIKNYLWALPFCCFILGYQSLKYVYAVPTTHTPSLVGRPVHEALRVLSDYNLNIRILAEKEDGDLPHGTILRQTPAPNTPIKHNQSIFCVLSKQPDRIPAPNLLNTSKKRRENLADKADVRVREYMITSNNPRGHCIAQHPAPNHLLDHDKKMIAYVSADIHKPVIMPNLKERDLAAVQDFLNMYPTDVRIVQHPSKKKKSSTQRVVDQRPLAGSIITLSEHKPLVVQLQVR